MKYYCTMNHYYTCPLSAAWMSKKFGIKFTGDGWTLQFGSAGQYIAFPGKYYIHRDSLHILDPQIGDTIKKSEDVYIIGPNHHEYRGRSQFITIAESDGVEIIQRNGAAFMWPEVEL